MNKKIFWIILGLLLISFTLQQEEGDTEQGEDAGTGGDNEEGGDETPDDYDLCEAKTKKDECFKVQLSSNDKKCCFYDVTPPEGAGDKFTKCIPKIPDEEKKQNENEGYKIKEECSGKFLRTSILVLLALFFF